MLGKMMKAMLCVGCQKKLINSLAVALSPASRLSNNHLLLMLMMMAVLIAAAGECLGGGDLICKWRIKLLPPAEGSRFHFPTLSPQRSHWRHL